MPTHTPKIIPAILAKNEREFKTRAMIMDGVAEIVQIDLMDGVFVPAMTWDHPEVVAEWGLKLKYELHCMCANPIPVVERWRRVAGLKRVIIHAEAPITIAHALSRIRKHKLEAGLAISPGTPLSVVADHAKNLDMVLVMGGTPGAMNQRMDRNTINTVRELREKYPSLPIGFDIGVTRQTIPALVQAGVTRLYVGHAIFRSPAPLKAYKELEEITKAAK